MSNWTDEKFNLMVDKLIERKKRETDAVKGNDEPHGDRVVSDSEFLSMVGIKVVKA